MIVRSLILATTLLAAAASAALAQSATPAQSLGDVIASPVLRASVNVTGDVVRIGDVIDNAGTSAQIAIYRAPDLGTTGSLPTPLVIAALQAHQVIGVNTKDIKAISVTRLARIIDSKEIENQVARAIEHRGGLGDAANLTLNFDGDLQSVRLEFSYTGDLQPVSVRVEPRSGHFDVSFEIGNDANVAPARLRFTGTAIETVEAAILTRTVERSEVIKSSDVITERRPKFEVGGDLASRSQSVGMQARKQVRAGQPLRNADLGKPDLVQRDENVTLIYEAAGLYLTIRGKAMESGTEGDVVNVMNLQSKRSVPGVVIGRGQVAISVATPRLPAVSDASSTTGAIETSQPVSVASGNNSPVSPKDE
jgi:flagella basal body P-ring formation protein FlgA